jgi:hypothetical protein
MDDDRVGWLFRRGPFVRGMVYGFMLFGYVVWGLVTGPSRGIRQWREDRDVLEAGARQARGLR